MHLSAREHDSAIKSMMPNHHQNMYVFLSDPRDSWLRNGIIIKKFRTRVHVVCSVFSVHHRVRHHLSQNRTNQPTTWRRQRTAHISGRFRLQDFAKRIPYVRWVASTHIQRLNWFYCRIYDTRIHCARVMDYVFLVEFINLDVGILLK